MRVNLVICVALLTGCVIASAQMFPSDQFHPFPSRFPSRIPNRNGNPYTPLVLDTHVDCLRELKETKAQLVDTNEIIQTIKNELMEEIFKLRNELEEIKYSSGNVEVEELKIQLNETKETVKMLAAEITENYSLLSDAMIAVVGFDDQFTGTTNNLTNSLAEVNVAMGELREQISVINANDLTGLNSKVEYLESEMNGIKKQSANHSDRFVAITESFETTNDLVADLKTDLKANVNDVTEIKDNVEKLNAALKESTSPSSIGKMPTSCADLKQIGHVKSGFYSVMGSNSIQNVYCDFTLAKTNEKLIGAADIKSKPTYFSVQRTSPFTTANTSIPFDMASVNMGGAMNLATGVFTAPVPGIYSFSFKGLAEFQTTQSIVPFLAVGLYVNKERVALALNEESNTQMTNNRGQRSQLSLMTTVELKKGDRVWLDMFAKSGAISLYDNANKHTDFSGWLMQEYLSSK